MRISPLHPIHFLIFSFNCICYIVGLMELVQSPSIKKDTNFKVEEHVEGSNSQVHNSLRLLTEAKVFQMKFGLEGDAHTFYNLYARVIGLSIRKDRRKMWGQCGNE